MTVTANLSRNQNQSLLGRTYRGDLERHLGGLALPPDARVRDARVVPHDVLAARLEPEVLDEDSQDDLCACEAGVNVRYCENSVATY